MRQRLPDTAPEPLYVGDIGRIVRPGEEFDCPDPVPGCVAVDPPAEESAEDGGEPLAADVAGIPGDGATDPAADDPPAGVAAEDPPATAIRPRRRTQ